MGRGAHAGCNRTRVAWAGGLVAAVASAWLLQIFVHYVLVLVLYGMLGMYAYSKREMLSSYCRPPGESASRTSRPTCRALPLLLRVSLGPGTPRSSVRPRGHTEDPVHGAGSDWIQNTMVPGMDDDEDEWAEPTPTRKAEEEEKRCERRPASARPLRVVSKLSLDACALCPALAAQAASSGLAARLEAAFAAEEKRKETESEARAQPVRVVAPPDEDDYEFDEDAIEAEEDAYFNPGPSGGGGRGPAAAPAPSSKRDALDDEADEFF
jgi:hypothetical protein